MKTAGQIIEWIHAAPSSGGKRRLQITCALMDALHAWPQVPVIHVAGTNGKGSTCAMLESILRAAGYRTGLYTSPFLQVYNERIRLNGVPVSDELLERVGNRVLDVVQRLEEEQNFRAAPFEIGTVLAFSVFQEAGAQVQVIETGLGGRLDQTNVLPHPTVCGITAIGMDHMHILGNTLEEIAAEKAGIIKPGVPVVCHPMVEAAGRVMRDTAEKRGAELLQLTEEMISDSRCGRAGSVASFSIGQSSYENMEIALPGRHQLTNALTVLGLVQKLQRAGLCIPEEALRQGLRTAVWPCRLEWCGNVLMDGGHNEQGLHALADFVTEQLPDEKRVLLLGVLREKLSQGMLCQMARLGQTAVTLTPDNPRAMPAEELAELLKQQGLQAEAASSMVQGLEQAQRLAGEKGIVIAAGSLYFVGELRSLLGLKP